MRLFFLLPSILLGWAIGAGFVFGVQGLYRYLYGIARSHRTEARRCPHPAACPTRCLLNLELILPPLTAKTHPRCECGYSINATNTSTPFALFTDFLETDFLHLYNLPDSIDIPASEAVGWAVQAYNISPNASRGPYGKAAELDNVVLNPLPTRDDWAGEGKLGGAPGLQMWVRGEQDLLSQAGNQMIRVGEINSLRRDMQYGSFRVGMKMSDVAGTCAAFFWVGLLLSREMTTS